MDTKEHEVKTRQNAVRKPTIQCLDNAIQVAANALAIRVSSCPFVVSTA